MVSSVMSSIDSIKDKITDGEYLNLCNLLKGLNDEIKNPSDQVYVRNQRESIEDLINEFFENPEFYREDEEGERVMTKSDVFLKFNEFLEELVEEYLQDEEETYFICACGCSVRARCISDHIGEEMHATNFSY